MENIPYNIADEGIDGLIIDLCIISIRYGQSAISQEEYFIKRKEIGDRIIAMTKPL